MRAVIEIDEDLALGNLLEVGCILYRELQRSPTNDDLGRALSLVEEILYKAFKCDFGPSFCDPM